MAERLAGAGGAVLSLPRPSGIDPPTQLPPTGASRDFDPLVATYATVPYADVNPGAGRLAYVVMFGMMFADAGHGASWSCRLAVRWRWSPRLARFDRLAVPGRGRLSSMVFGVLYGEFFGPTGVMPVLWLAPLDQPVPLLVAGVAVGALLLAALRAGHGQPLP